MFILKNLTFLKKELAFFFGFSVIIFGFNCKILQNPDTPNIKKSIVKFNPLFSQGYLILDKNIYHSVKNWEISIVYKNSSEKDKENVRVVQTVNLNSSKSYWRIPEKYQQKDGNYFYKIKGLDDAKSVLIEEPLAAFVGVGEGDHPPICTGCPILNKGCEWTCNGKTYAWTIKQWIHPDFSKSMLDLRTAVAHSDGFNYYPYYLYMSENAFFNNFCPNTNNWTHITNSCSPNGISIVGPLDGSDNVYHNALGAVISGNVYGVAKTKGVWRGSPIQTKLELLYGTEVCVNDLNWAIAQMNIYGDFSRGGSLPNFPKLKCNPAVGVSGSGSNFSDFSGFSSCLGISFIDYNDFYEYLDAVDDCREGEGWNGAWLDVVEGISITNLVEYNTGTLPITIDVDKLFDKDGVWIGQDFTLKPGLYAIGIELKTGKYIPLIQEATKSLPSGEKRN